MKLTQKELAYLHKQDRTQVFNYRKAYQIEYCHGTSSFILRELDILRKYNGLPYTKRGRYVAFNIEQANKLLKG